MQVVKGSTVDKLTKINSFVSVTVFYSEISPIVSTVIFPVKLHCAIAPNILKNIVSVSRTITVRMPINFCFLV